MDFSNIQKVLTLLKSTKILVIYSKRSYISTNDHSNVVQDINIETRWSSKLAMLHIVQSVIEKIRLLLQERHQENKMESIDIVLKKNVIDL